MTLIQRQILLNNFLIKAFCPTGPGGGVDPTCSPGGGGGRSFSGVPYNPNGKDTTSQYRKPDGSWTPERQKLHDKIVDNFLRKSKSVSNPVSYMMGGGPASGKSVAIRQGFVKLPKKHLAIDSDEIKKEIPEYNDLLSKKDVKAAAFAHEESSYLAKRILKESVDKKYNTLLDGTGDSSLESLRKKTTSLKKSGRKVVANYVTVDTEVALERNRARAAKTGRMPPEDFVRQAHKNISNIVPKAIKEGLFDEFHLFDTGQAQTVRVASAKGKKLIIHNQELWDAFLAKGK